MSFEPRSGRIPRAPSGAAPLLVWTLLAALLPGAVTAQERGANGASGESEEAAERARAIERADSLRALLQQPPGDRGGITAMDVIRVPFDLFGGALSMVLVAGFGAIDLLDETGVLDVALETREELAERDIYVEPDFIGSRSWPALVAEYRGLDPFFLEAGYSLRRYELYGAGVELGDESSTGARAAGRHHVMRALHFWGVGPDSESADRSDFALTRTVAGADAWSGFGGPVRVGIGAAWERSDVGRGHDGARPDLHDTFDPDALFGAASDVTFLRWGPVVDADLTHLSRFQTHGARLLGGYSVFEGIDGTDAGFHRGWADARAYVPVTRWQTIALRVLAEDRFAEKGDGVPFTHLAELGDDEGLRGYTSRRFRDRALLAGQAEWRWEVWWHPGVPDARIDAFGFADYGAVASSLSELDGSDFMLTPGFGLRFFEETIGTVETFVAFGGDGTRVDISLGSTF